MTALGVAAEPHDEPAGNGLCGRLLGELLERYAGEDDRRGRNRAIFELRTTNPHYWTQERLARQFGVSSRTVCRALADVPRSVAVLYGRANGSPVERLLRAG